MVAKRPDITLSVEVKNTAGEILKYFPVEVQSGPNGITRDWQTKKKLIRRTDENGRCTFTDVPDIEGLKIILDDHGKISGEKLSDEVKKIVEENIKTNYWSEQYVEITEGQKEYNISAIALTSTEYRNKKQSEN